jgi:hypothetical protein
MSQATNDYNTPTRRSALGFGAAAIVAGLATPAIAGGPDPDGELIALCAEFDALERGIKAYYPGGAKYILCDAERDNATAPLDQEQRGLIDRMCELRASTLNGIRARARTLVLWAADEAEGAECKSNCLDDRMRAAISRDLIAGSVAA